MKRMKRAVKWIVILFSMMIIFSQTSAEKQSTLHYVALGDSLAAGLTSDGESYVTSYPDFIYKDLVNNLSFVQIDYTSTGVPGYTTADVLKLLQNVNHVRDSVAEADFITIGIGANDIVNAIEMKKVLSKEPEHQKEMKERTDQAIHQLAKNLHLIIYEVEELNPQAPLFVMGYYNPAPYIQDAQPFMKRMVTRFNGAIEGVAVTTDAYFIPTYDVFVENYPKYLPNRKNIHPNEAGYRAIAEEFLPEIVDYLVADGWEYTNEFSEKTRFLYYVDVHTLYQWVHEKWDYKGDFARIQERIHPSDVLYGSGPLLQLRDRLLPDFIGANDPLNEVNTDE
ncbi:MAG TPA: GDSL-type esterase/lipase family protein [Bacillota bacterium]